MNINPFKPFTDRLAEHSEAQEVISRLRELGLSESERRQIFEVAETFAKAGVIPPVHLAETFCRIIATQRIDGHDLIAFGRSGIGVQIQAGVLAALRPSWRHTNCPCDVEPRRGE